MQQLCREAATRWQLRQCGKGLQKECALCPLLSATVANSNSPSGEQVVLGLLTK